MLDETLVMCTTEFGRQPACSGWQRAATITPARSPAGWRAAGSGAGSAYGSSDELGSQAAENPTYCYDIHATALHLLGLQHDKLTFYNNGIRRRLTDVHGHLIPEIIA